MNCISMQQTSMDLVPEGVEFLGEFTESELIGADALTVLLGVTVGQRNDSSGRWLGFNDNGVVKYVAMQPFRVGVSWDELASQNLALGNTQASVRGQRYTVRVLDGGPAAGGEWDRLFGAITRDLEIHRYHPIELGLGRFQAGRVSWCCNANASDLTPRFIGRGGMSMWGEVASHAHDRHVLFGWRPVLECV